MDTESQSHEHDLASPPATPAGVTSPAQVQHLEIRTMTPVDGWEWCSGSILPSSWGLQTRHWADGKGLKEEL